MLWLATIEPKRCWPLGGIAAAADGSGFRSYNISHGPGRWWE